MAQKPTINITETNEISVTNLLRQFSGCCNGAEEMLPDTPNQCLEFALKVIYEIGTKAKRVKKGMRDHCWKFNFANEVKITNTKNVKHVFVATFKNGKPKLREFDYPDTLLLTVKQAGYIALTIIKDFVDICAMSGKILLTPLAAACYRSQDIKDIFTELLSIEYSGQPGDKKPGSIGDVINNINCSCQPGGQDLADSSMACSLVAVLIKTQDIEDKNLKDRIINKIKRQYQIAGKIYNESAFNIFAKYGHGPTYMVIVDNILQIYSGATATSIGTIIDCIPINSNGDNANNDQAGTN